ncbi:MAG TPA: hypothetical protein VFO27_19745, partial [Bryobacteraceae bacterium]|nr:hypothetical protein [Bryobacteraceae bacterium]
MIGEQPAEVQLRLANRLWNTLVAIRLAHTERYKKVMRDPVQERINELKQKASDLRDEMKARRQKARKRKKVDISDLKAALDDVMTEMKILIEEQKRTSKARHAAKKVELAA